MEHGIRSQREKLDSAITKVGQIDAILPKQSNKEMKEAIADEHHQEYKNFDRKYQDPSEYKETSWKKQIAAEGANGRGRSRTAMKP
ncbi:hypothetical protein Tco_0588387 [Tanacetum coccineum]